MSGLGLHPVIPWPLALALGTVVLAVAVLGLVTRPARRVQWALRTGVAALVTLALLGPGVAGGDAPQAGRLVNVWFVADTTSSAAARDYQGEKPRLEGYRADVPKIARAMPGARFSVITFDSSARTQMPLTTDTNALRTSLQTMRQELTTYSAGSSITVARDELRRSLEASRERYPERARVVFYLGDGEQTSGQQPAPMDLGDLVDGGAVLGYGTAEGGPMAQRSTSDGDEGDIETADGQPAISSIDEAALRAVAGQIGVPYVGRNDGGDISPVLAEARPSEVVEEALGTSPGHVSLVWLLGLLAAALMLLDVAVLARDLARVRGVRP